MAEAKLHYICSKLQYKYNDILQTLREKGKLSTREYIDFVDDMENSFDDLTSGLPRLTRNHLRDETNKLLDHVSNIIYDLVHDPKSVPEQLEYYYFFDSSGNAKLVERGNLPKSGHMVISSGNKGRKRKSITPVIKEPTQYKPEKQSRTMISKTRHIKPKKTQQDKEYITEIKRLFKKFIKIQDEILKGVDKVDKLKSDKSKMTSLEKLLVRLKELKNVEGILKEVMEDGPEKEQLLEIIYPVEANLYAIISDKYGKIESPYYDFIDNR